MAERNAPGEAVELPNDDCVITFRTDKSGIRGRLVRLGPVADTILKRHHAPEPVSHVMGEALVLASLLGSALPENGKIILQTRSDGAVSFLVADFEAASGAGALRGYARFEAAKLDLDGSAALAINSGELLGGGTMAITIDQGPEKERYQAVTALDDGVPLQDAAAAYFEDREALPTFVRLSMARLYSGGKGDAPSSNSWRAGGLMMQHDRSPSRDEGSVGGDDDNWRRVRMLAETVEDHEILDPSLTTRRLLLRLFHEEGVRIERVTPIRAQCRCSRARIANVLKSFGADELADMRDDDGRITVTCEFCTTSYAFALSEIDSSDL